MFVHFLADDHLPRYSLVMPNGISAAMRLASAVLCSSADSTSKFLFSCDLHETPANDNLVYRVIVFVERVPLAFLQNTAIYAPNNV